MGRETFLKRKKESERREKRAQKAARTLERKREKPLVGNQANGEDPDIAGIRPGPQPKIYY
ncbi:MAG: hypothetical protein ACREQW_16825 [Candidatus Binatia bacterium]